MRKVRPIPVLLTQADLEAIAALPHARHAAIVAAVRIGLPLLAANPELLRLYHPTARAKRE